MEKTLALHFSQQSPFPEPETGSNIEVEVKVYTDGPATIAFQQFVANLGFMHVTARLEQLHEQRN